MKNYLNWALSKFSVFQTVARETTTQTLTAIQAISNPIEVQENTIQTLEGALLPYNFSTSLSFLLRSFHTSYEFKEAFIENFVRYAGPPLLYTLSKDFIRTYVYDMSSADGLLLFYAGGTAVNFLATSY